MKIKLELFNPLFIAKEYLVTTEPVFSLPRGDGSFKYVKRTGTCDPSKHDCKAACCRSWVIRAMPPNDPTRDYQAKFGKFQITHKLTGEEIELFIIDKDCAALKEGKCSIHKTRPAVCYQFPTPNDSTYLAVKEVCSYEFKEITKKEFDQTKEAEEKCKASL